MTTKADHARRDEKAERVANKIAAVAENPILLNMLDEWKLDLMLIAFGDGKVVLRD